MRRVGWVSRVWRRASFSLKFAVVMLVAGALIAVVPLMLAAANTQTQALDGAADKVGVASNLVQGQRTSLEGFIAGVARQLTATNDLGDTAATLATLREDAGVNASHDILGIVQTDGDVLAVRGRVSVESSTPLTRALLEAVLTGAPTMAAPDGTAWLMAVGAITSSAATAFVARPVTAAFISAVEHNLSTAANPASLDIVGPTGRYALSGVAAGIGVRKGEVPDSSLAHAVASEAPSVVTVMGRQAAVATSSLGAGYTLVVTTPVAGVAASLQPLLLLFTLILVSMLFIVIVVQTDLQRPLRRLDRAVAGISRGEFDLPVPSGGDDEVGRLGTTFDAMRRQLRSTMRATAARAAVATELNSSQPLQTALVKVCAELRRTLEVDGAIILVDGSEMNDPFAIVEGVRDIDVDAFLSGDGPLGEGYRSQRSTALTIGAAPASAEAHLGLREFCVAPLRLGQRVRGVLAIGNAAGGFPEVDADLVGSTAEQIALALERYRFLAVVQRQASVDDLTGLHNHRFFVDYLNQQVALAERLGAPLALLMLDIDHFKALNDTHGHQAGDSALAAFARTLLNSVRRADLAARYGGEEFAVVMANTSAAEARLVAEKIRSAVAAVDIPLADRPPLRMTVSVGGAAYPENTGSAGALLSLADDALYRAKGAGRNRTCMAGATTDPAPPRHPLAIVQDAQPMEIPKSVGAGGRSRPSQ